MICSVCRPICRYGLLSLVDAHHDDPVVSFNRPFLAGVLAFSSEEAVNWLSKMYPSAKPTELSSHDAKRG